MRRSQDNSLLLIAYAIENQRTVTGLRVGKGVGLGVGDWLGLCEGDKVGLDVGCEMRMM